jgi:hypothetical protein
MSLTVENKTFITNRSVDQTESKRAMGAGIPEISTVNVGSEAMPDFYSLMKNNKNGETKYAGKGSVEVH